MFTFDTIRDIKICQRENGYRFSVDALILFSFVNLQRVRRIIDLGAGSGIIGILLAKKYPEATVTLIEVQDGLARLAEHNVASNMLQDRINILNMDIMTLFDSNHPDIAHEKAIPLNLLNELSFKVDLVVSNPPFRKINTGLLNYNHENAIARHELKLSLGNLIKSASLLLKHHGRFCIIHLPERLTEIITFMREYDLEPKRLRFVHSNQDSGAKMVLVEVVKGGMPDLKIEKPFFIYNKDGTYTDEMREIYDVS